MAVETFFLMGFRAMSDMIKDIFPPGEDNALAKAMKQEGDSILKLLENALKKLKDIAFEEEYLRFHIIKQLEPAFGHTIILKMDPIKPIALAFNKTADIFKAKWATDQEIAECSGIVFPFDLFKRFLIEDLDVLKLITENQVYFEKFLELDDIIVRALLGFTSAFFLQEEFRERVKKELPSSI
ncbi:MAG: hypothetical protein ACTSQJ_03155 [Promethearchaeota archaeon]